MSQTIETKLEVTLTKLEGLAANFSDYRSTHDKLHAELSRKIDELSTDIKHYAENHITQDEFYRFKETVVLKDEYRWVKNIVWGVTWTAILFILMALLGTVINK